MQSQSQTPGMEGGREPPNIAAAPAPADAAAETPPAPKRVTTRIRGPAPAGAAPNSAPIGIGSILSTRYLLEHFLGEGDMGVVYRALDLEVKGELFAVKVLDRGAGDTPESLALLREAVRTTRTLRHPGILAVNSINADPSGLYLLMEHLEGRSLAAILETEPGHRLPLDRAWPLIKDMGAALAHAHTDQRFHGDLKPTNVFVNAAGRAILLDFGIARAVRSAADAAPEAQSPYASLELLESRPPDPSDDVYSLACLIYEMLTGRHPYDGLTAIDARAAHSIPKPVDSLTGAQNQALAKALTLARSDRTASINALLVQLDPGGSPARPASRRLNPWVLGSAGLAVCLIIGVAVWWIMAGSAPKLTASSPAPTPAGAAPTPAPSATPAGSTAVADKIAAPTPPAPPPEPEPSLSFTEPPAAAPEAAPARAEIRKPAPIAASIPSTKPTPAASDARPPPHANVPSIAPTAAAAAGVDACPYPQEARRMMETGTVILLVRVGPDGGVLDTAIDQSSGSEVLDHAAAQCVLERGRFSPRPNRKPAGSYWGRMKFNWSFG
jgi:TonB family protein